MRWVEDKGAAVRSGLDVREFVNVGEIHRAEFMPTGVAPEFALWWTRRVRQVGTRKTGRMLFVELFFEEGSRRMRGSEASTVLWTIQRYRTDRNEGLKQLMLRYDRLIDPETPPAHE